MTPLSEKLRPQNFKDVSGQQQTVEIIETVIKSGKPMSFLFFGPPGCGKTTLARLYAKSFSLPLIQLSAVLNSVQELKKILKDSQDSPLFNRQTLVFVDEIHRFNRSQQDIFLPFIEDGSLILVGATTENPSFVLNNALLSRLRVLKLEPLVPGDLEQIVERYLKSGSTLCLSKEEKKQLIFEAGGDARYLLNMIENLETGLKTQKKPPLYDRDREGHYHLISALHKAVRGSDPDAALYWLARMLEGGEDPLFLARRMIRMASEDIGLADPNALTVALNAWNAYKMLGSPEGDLALAETIVYLALSPKSNALYRAFGQAKQLASGTGHLAPPKHILNAPTKLMREFGYGKDYQYDHDLPDAFSGDNYFPDSIDRQSFYRPAQRGFEREMKKRLEYFQKLREKKKTK